MLSNLSRSIMLRVAENQTIRKIVTKYGMADKKGFARRFIAGETLKEAIEATKDLNKNGIKVTLDLLGENVTSKEESIEARDVFLNILDEIHKSGIDSNISMKPTQLGLDLGIDLCFENFSVVLARAKKYKNFVRMDMESSDYTQITLELFSRLYEKYPDNIGIVLQSYLYRTEPDVREVAKSGARIRICKGAYLEPEIVAFQKKNMVDDNYVRCAKHLLDNAKYPGIATHDDNMLNAVKEYAKDNKISPDNFEFQMLYGVRRDMQQILVNEGYNMRVYVPFGTEWFPYFSRRLGERIGNVMFILKSIFQDDSLKKEDLI